MSDAGSTSTDVPGLPDAAAVHTRARPGPRWIEWVAFGVFNVAFGTLPDGGRPGYGLALLGAAAVFGGWQYRWPRDLAERLTLAAVFAVLGGVVALVPVGGTSRLTPATFGLVAGAVAGMVLAERLRRARHGT